MKTVLVSTMGAARRLWSDGQNMLALAIVLTMLLAVVALLPLATPPAATSGSGGHAHDDMLQQDEVLLTLLGVPSGSTVRAARNYMLEQDDLLERLLTEAQLAAIATSTTTGTVACDNECLQILTQQMLDLAEQMRDR